MGIRILRLIARMKNPSFLIFDSLNKSHSFDCLLLKPFLD